VAVKEKQCKIQKLKQEDDKWFENWEGLSNMTTCFFHDLFTREEEVDPDTLMHLFDNKVSAEMNERLCQEFSNEEISDALFQIGPLKAPGPDGFPPHFFQRNWGVMKEEIITAVKEFFQSSVMPHGVNDTTIVLIQKVAYPEKLSEFRPISLCNVLYKIVSKCLVNRL
jgi:hypothetical protein